MYATFVFGYDLDTAETFERVFDFAVNQQFFAAFNHLVCNGLLNKQIAYELNVSRPPSRPT